MILDGVRELGDVPAGMGSVAMPATGRSLCREWKVVYLLQGSALHGHRYYTDLSSEVRLVYTNVSF